MAVSLEAYARLRKDIPILQVRRSPSNVDKTVEGMIGAEAGGVKLELGSYVPMIF